MTTGFFTDERCFWHSGGNYAFMVPAGGLVQPTSAGGLPENPETKRRLRNLMEVTGLLGELDVRGAEPTDRGDLMRVHTGDMLYEFRQAAKAGGGEIGLRAPFGPDGYDIACLSAGLGKAALFAVLDGEISNAYALTRPPGHHCLPDWQNGFCLLANGAIAGRERGTGRTSTSPCRPEWGIGRISWRSNGWPCPRSGRSSPTPSSLPAGSTPAPSTLWVGCSARPRPSAR